MPGLTDRALRRPRNPALPEPLGRARRVSSGVDRCHAGLTRGDGGGRADDQIPPDSVIRTLRRFHREGAATPVHLRPVASSLPYSWRTLMKNTLLEIGAGLGMLAGVLLFWRGIRWILEALPGGLFTTAWNDTDMFLLGLVGLVLLGWAISRLRSWPEDEQDGEEEGGGLLAVLVAVWAAPLVARAEAARRRLHDNGPDTVEGPTKEEEKEPSAAADVEP